VFAENELSIQLELLWVACSVKGLHCLSQVVGIRKITKEMNA
jgi:hypothetical protein